MRAPFHNILYFFIIPNSKSCLICIFVETCTNNVTFSLTDPSTNKCHGSHYQASSRKLEKVSPRNIPKSSAVKSPTPEPEVDTFLPSPPSTTFLLNEGMRSTSGENCRREDDDGARNVGAAAASASVGVGVRGTGEISAGALTFVAGV